MANKRQPSEHWKADPDAHDYPAASDYLGLLLPETAAAAVVEELKRSPISRYKAKDLLRASRLAVLAPDNHEVAKDLRRVAKGDLLSPVLLVRGQADRGVALIVADGYHRVCASYHLNEDADVPCRIAALGAVAEGARGPEPG